MKHTPTPWHVGMKPGPMIYGTKGEQIADMMEANGEADLFPYVGENQANAAFIVRACNSHDDLVSALGACQMALLGYTHQNDITQKALALAQSALSKSKDTK